MERVSNSGVRTPKLDKLTVYDDYELWEDRKKVYLEAVDECARPAAILEQLANEVYMVARAANLTASAARVRTVVNALGCPCPPQKSPKTRRRVCRGLPTTSLCPGLVSLPKRALYRARGQDF
ncbi:unnamed protein product [Schistocephalus solidus]|uniref:DUF4158 domain-containing protein n=1 Tax=Schistocephalus solidus TaxID=70667 RepID=A0A183S962_SCHSO|nr:unnamed protein product [Schistocephalus solidus]